METLFISHIALVYISLGLLLLRGVLSVKQVDWRQYKILKIAPHIVDTLLLASGIGLFVLLGYGAQPWVIAKLFFLVMYVLYAVKAFKKNQPFSIKHFLLAVVSFMMILFVATFK
ncbi:invasion protein expression up-regulator SirB [Pasteurellaceae bacterium 15-036681]|nr:invasion protein expression up-regulator SirB [Pasteurellaceae bacterium 15-036681]